MRGLPESDLLLEEAQETENEYDSYDSAAEDEFYNGVDSADENPYWGRVFHLFPKLPPELRVRVWELALAEEAEPRILHFDLGLLPRPVESEFEDDFVIDWTVHPSKQLAAETRHVRRVIAVNREARAVVLKTLPHTVRVRSKRIGRRPATVHLHRDRDIAYISGDDEFVDRLRFELREVWQEGRCDFDGFAENVTQLAINCSSLEYIDEFDDEAIYAHILSPLTNLKRLFLELPRCEELRLGDKIWAGSEFVYTHQVAIRDRGNGYHLERRVWPNADEYDDFARQVPVPTFQQPGLPSTKRLAELSHDAAILPMFVFEDRGGYQALERLRASWQEAYSRGIPVDELSDWSLDGVDDLIDQIFGFTEPDEYESEGIDDSEIMEPRTDDDSDEDDLSGDQVYGGLHSSDGDDADDDSDSGSDAVNGHQNDNSLRNGDAGAFSSPEPEPEPVSISGTQNPRKRRIVADSDDELPSDVSRKRRARNGGFSSGIRSDTDDDEGVSEASVARKRRRRPAVVDSDDEDDDGEDDGNGGKGTAKGETGKKRNDLGQGDSDDEDDSSDDEDDSASDDDEEDEDEDEQNEVKDVRQQSLASRLGIVPPRVPRHRSSAKKRNDSTDDEEDDEEEEEEDDEDDSEDDEDDERSEDGLIDGIAEESDMSD